MQAVVHIKNMVCPRCIEAIKNALGTANIGFEKVSLGEALIKRPLDPGQKKRLTDLLKEQGFELLEDETSGLISSIKGLIIGQIHYASEPLKVNFSTFLSEKLSKDYSSMSKLFSAVESITIEKFITAQKIERAKELLIYDQMTLSQISHLIGYSSVGHLSAQFKKETGQTPTHFKKARNASLRKPINSI